MTSPPAGCLQEQDIERWILDLYPSITNRSAFAHDSPEFLAVYIAAASRAFFFFLDPHRLGRVHIDALVESPITDALLEVTLTAVRRWYFVRETRIERRLLKTTTSGLMSRNCDHRHTPNHQSPILLLLLYHHDQSFSSSHLLIRRPLLSRH